MKTQYYTATSLDGFIATEDDSLDWLYALADVKDSSYPEFIAEVGAIAMGSTTYQWILDHAEQAIEEMGTAWPYSQPVWVFTSRTLPKVPDAAINFVQGDVRSVHQAMQKAAGDKNIWIAGGGDLVGQFYDAGLLNDLILQIGSAILGNGRPLLLRRIIDPPLRLSATRQMGSGMIELRYEVCYQ